ncbi:class I SAM-dependent methyltransferase [Patiriisocius hiemis]|uniref:Class I SAM-dependent methyltransferase n=1 Tax=Patiriisocius hiemis TaxID=3075604 RepID=A0ABU2Y911_9FLAO|nr:class I SAM-dependent methyltransferase [Constantimarinum sp. W242]MDT0554661.1 class I SAM-dependent methyltransferase [Constantimarinum sp. W242]
MHPDFIASPEKEKERYLKHQNDVTDLGYKNFVSPIINTVLTSFSKSAKGLDFGAGTGPVISTILKEKGYKTKLYDPFFHSNKNVLTETYDYIICCEVIEHFNYPKKEFELLKKLLKPGGKLICMTHLLPKLNSLKNWYYLRDFTHVFFYSEATVNYIKDTFRFKEALIDDRLIVLSV